MATATATAASLGGQMRAEPYPTYANAATGIETAFNIIKAELTGKQTWRFVADENAPGYVRGVAAALNAAGSTWDHVNQGGWAATDAAFNFANWATATNAADAELIKAMMALFEEATALGMSPVKASMAVMLANMYPGIRVEFNYTTPQAAAPPQQSQNGGNGDRPGEDQYSQYSAGTSTPEGEDPNANSPYMIGDFGEVAAQNGR